jgi:hypothetical protein
MNNISVRELMEGYLNTVADMIGTENVTVTGQTSGVIMMDGVRTRHINWRLEDGMIKCECITTQ